MAGYSDFSFTALWARIGGKADGVLRATGNASRGAVVPLPEEERAVLAARITPHLDALEALRLRTLATVDRRARVLVPLSGVGMFTALLASGHGLAGALILGFTAALVGWFVAMGNRSAKYQAEVKARFATLTSSHLAGFDHLVEPQTDLAHLRGWHLFPDLRSATTSDRITGRRGGRNLALSEMSIAYAPNPISAIDHMLSCSVVEVSCSSMGEAKVVLTPKDAPHRILEAQRKARDLMPASTGDPAFDAVYSVRSSSPEATRRLTTELRMAILALDEVAPAGRPYLVLLPGYLAVLFPTTLADLAFHVPPYWVRIDAETLLEQFASDLAVRNGLVDAATHLSS